MRKRNEAEINRLLDEFLPGVFEQSTERERTALVKALEMGMHPDAAQEFAEGAEERAALDSRRVEVMDVITKKYIPKDKESLR